MRLSLINDFYFEVELSGNIVVRRRACPQKGGRDITGVLLKEKEENMKRSRFSEEQIIGILREAEAGELLR